LYWLRVAQFHSIGTTGGSGKIIRGVRLVGTFGEKMALIVSLIGQSSLENHEQFDFFMMKIQ